MSFLPPKVEIREKIQSSVGQVSWTRWPLSSLLAYWKQIWNLPDLNNNTNTLCLKVYVLCSGIREEQVIWSSCKEEAGDSNILVCLGEAFSHSQGGGSRESAPRNSLIPAAAQGHRRRGEGRLLEAQPVFTEGLATKPDREWDVGGSCSLLHPQNLAQCLEQGGIPGVCWQTNTYQGCPERVQLQEEIGRWNDYRQQLVQNNYIWRGLLMQKKKKKKKKNPVSGWNVSLSTAHYQLSQSQLLPNSLFSPQGRIWMTLLLIIKEVISKTCSSKSAVFYSILVCLFFFSNDKS